MKKIVYDRPYLFSSLWALFIFVLCATPGQYVPSADWLDLLSFDKLVHAFMFFILCSLLFTGASRYEKKSVLIVLFLLTAVAYGGMLEIMQAKCFSNRSADWQDFVANSFGCLVALLLLKKTRRYFTT
ncbi:MAG TPA: VanZ family protein [Bacteroidia bacterium]|nr:VanZ family protein [Bacteroidia bacterium]